MFVPDVVLLICTNHMYQGIPPVNKNLNADDGWVIATAKKLSDWWEWVGC
jgi:hypothetical protein